MVKSRRPWDEENEEEDEDQLPEYEKEHHQRFVAECRAAGIPVRHYDGRFNYHGPAASTSDDFDEQDIIRATTVNPQRDNLGLGMILYPHH